MYIAFEIYQIFPNFTIATLDYEIRRWAEQYQIPYTTKIHKHTFRLGLNDPSHFTLFFTTWTGPEYRVIEP